VFNEVARRISGERDGNRTHALAQLNWRKMGSAMRPLSIPNHAMLTASPETAE
jgi:hypothetical protein